MMKCVLVNHRIRKKRGGGGLHILRQYWVGHSDKQHINEQWVNLIGDGYPDRLMTQPLQFDHKSLTCRHIIYLLCWIVRYFKIKQLSIYSFNEKPI